MIHDLNLQIIRTERKKTATIKVLPGEVIQVVAPKELTDPEIHSLIRKRSSWIIENLRKVLDVPTPRKREFVSGESFPLLGKNYRLKILLNYSGEVSLRNNRIYISVPKGLDASEMDTFIRQRLISWYKSQAIKKIKERTNVFAKKLMVVPNSVSIKEYRGRWGSCTPAGDLIFNWHLIMAPTSVLDYIVVHELCHINNPGHNKAFWRLVSSIKPNYRDDQKWLQFSGIEQII